MMSKKSPQLRFEGFTDDWEERKLRDLLNKNSEKNKNLSVINVESISNKTGFTKQTDQFEDYSVASADLSNYYVIREKQFAYNPSRINVGSIAYKDLGDEISVVSPLYVSFSTKKVLNDGFLWNWFKTASFDAQRQRLSEGGVRDTLSFNQLSEMNTMFPTYPEQEKIGSFFQQLDETIALHQRKLDLLIEQKKGFLQKMFPKHGEKVPELRFAGFADDWEQRKLGDFIDVKSGKDYKHLNSGPIPVYGTGGYMLSVDRALSDIDAIGIGRKGTIDKPYLLKAPFWTVDTLFYAVPKQNIDLQFSLSIFKKINWKKFDESTGVPSLSKTVINSVGAFVPSYEEQQKIGSFFKQLDETIALHQRKLDLLKEQKKGFLQKMFV